MRWGFHREFNPAVNNARSDKLEGGIWEEHPEYGPCHTMITTAASPLMAPVHDRIMPPLLRSEELTEWLAGQGGWDFQPFARPLVVTSCESPLARRPGNGPQQGELF